MRIGVYQNNPEFGLVEKNVQQAIKDLKGTKADLMILPELFNTGYQFVSKEEIETLAEEIPSGTTCRVLTEFSRSRGMFLVFGLAERDKSKIYNSAAIVGPEGFIGKYRKTHLFAEEKLFFNPGDTGFRVFDLGPARIGIMICFDWWFPEAARILALMGADIICHPANLVLPNCQKAMVTRSLENGVFSATANRIGAESRGGKKELLFTGESQILDSEGKILTNLKRDKTGISIVDINVKKARDKMVTPQNDRFSDRRPELYGTLLKKE
ncbi:nitrilase-related carbon-nitrogen hydrolase [Thermodesulfobacteriota bacterium]